MGWDEGQGDSFQRFPFAAPIRLSDGQMVAPHVVTETLGQLISDKRKARFRSVVAERTYKCVHARVVQVTRSARGWVRVPVASSAGGEQQSVATPHAARR
jgi:hypothetical protein